MAKVFAIVTIAAGAAVLMSGWAQSSIRAQAPVNVSWSSGLQLKSLADIPNRMREPVYGTSLKDKLIVTNGEASREIGNCEEYLNAMTAGFYPANNYGALQQEEFVRECYVLRDLRHARGAVSSNQFRWDKDSLARLPPILVPGAREVTEAAEQAGKRGETWQKFNPELTLTDLSDDSLSAEDSEFVYGLEILARADFDGDGVEDIAVWGSANGKGPPTWHHSEYILFTPKNGKFVRLTSDVPPFRMKAETSK